MTLHEKITAASKYLSDKEKQKVRNKAHDELIRLELAMENKDLTERINSFKEKFLICEIVYKELLVEHLKHKNKHVGDCLKISMSQVPYVFSFAGYDFDYEFLNKLFGAKKHQGKKSVKKLRDSLNHSLATADIAELNNRYDELIKLMNTFLNTIRSEEE